MAVSFDEGYSDVSAHLPDVRDAGAWGGMTPEGNTSWPAPPDLSPYLMRATAVIGATPQPHRLLAAINLPAPFVSSSAKPEGSRDCPHLSLSSVVIVGDLAFVDVSFRCGGVCGTGQLVALQRRGQDWQPVASTVTWLT
jgi:hypothetical protein